MSRLRVLLATLIVPVALVGGYLVSARSNDDSPPGVEVVAVDDEIEFEHDFTIPLGTAERIDAGEEVEIVPAELTVQVGDAVRIVNNDVDDHFVGVFFVGAGETLTQRFNKVAVLEYRCDVHPSGTFTLRVVEDLTDA